MHGKVKKTATTIYLPHDIVQNILLRLPAKSLLRSGAVCKQWNATISDPDFARAHLRLAKTSSCRLLRLCGGVNKRAEIVDFQNHELRLLSTVDDPPVVSHKSISSHCDGLYIIRHSNDVYALWNPSRRSYKKLDRYSFNRGANFICGICYDPLVNDYKIGDANRYAIFYHRNNSWSDLKEISNIDLWKQLLFRSGYAVTLHGSIYWVCFSTTSYRYVLVCFDGEDEKFKILHQFDDGYIQHAQLIPTVDDVGLYIVLLLYDGSGGCLLMMKKDEWTESDWTEEVPVYHGVDDHVGCFWPICGSRDDKIIFGDEYQYLLYDVAKTCFSTLENSPSSQFASSDLFPYVENLLWH